MENLIATINSAIDMASEIHFTISTDIISATIGVVPDAIDVGDNQIVVYCGQDLIDVNTEKIIEDSNEFFCKGNGCEYIISFE